MKDKRAVFLLVLLIALPLVSAAIPFDSNFYFIQDGANKIIGFVSSTLGPIFNALLGEYSGGYGNGKFTEQEIFLVRILLLILIFAFVNTAVKAVPKLKENRAVVFVISASVSLMAVRFMSKSDIIIGILLPYGVMGAAITTILPFFIFFYFVHSTGMGGAGRRLSWIVFAIIFIALWISNQAILPETAHWIYFACLCAIVISFMFDRSIHRYFALHELNLFFGKANRKAITALQAEYMNIINLETEDAKKRRTEIEDNLKRLGGEVP